MELMELRELEEQAAGAESGSARTKATTDLATLCEALLRADPDIRDIIQFGSSAYVPDLALDIDLLVTTDRKKEYDVYLDAVADWPVNVDVVVREPGQKIGKDVALSVCAAGRVLYGDGETVKEARTMPVPTYEEARMAITAGDEYLHSAAEAENELLQDRHYRTAFNALFDAARTAAMVYLNTEQTRWGELRRALPRRFSGWLRRIIDTLHIEYNYHGEYPRGDTDGEYHQWRDEVGRFIDALEQESDVPD